MSAAALALPGFDTIPGGTFASVEAFLQFQRSAVAGARYAVELDADAVWPTLDEAARARFRAAAADEAAQHGDTALWRRAWWLRAIGGRSRAPLEIATSVELADRLAAALSAAFAPAEPPTDRRAQIEAWWRGLTAASRQRIASYTADRVRGSARRLREEGVLGDGPARPVEDADAERHHRQARRRPPSRSAIARAREAADRAVEAQRRLDRRFVSLGPVCGACTRETGGCCSLTVPLLWREADYRLMALGDEAVPSPSPDTPAGCPFLGADGCRLSPDRRPHICRAFLCERAEAALGDELPAAVAEIGDLATARSQLTP